jgi:hypothetical protein
MGDTIEWDGGKIEQGRAVAGTPYIIGAYTTTPLEEEQSCKTCGVSLEGISLKLVRLGAGELVTGGVEVSGWVWCPACRERRDETE